METLIVCAINRPTKKMVKSVSFNPNFVFGFWSLYENTKILRNLCLHFARKDGQDGKKTEGKPRN